MYTEAATRLEQPGVVVGLAWTSMGGDILFIEAIATPGTGELKLTGQMGGVMTESAKIALSLVKKHLVGGKAGKLLSHHVDPKSGKATWIGALDWFKTHDIHLHIPSGAVPKDGPSAGITMAAALLSLLTGRKARSRLAMTGELSLTGKVLPVGGIKDKVLAAKRAGITNIVMPKLNQKDLKEIPMAQRKDIKFRFVSKVDEVFEAVLLEK